MKIINWCLYLYILLKQFYLFKSGTMQISDFFIIIAFACLLIYNKQNNSEEYNKIKIKISKNLYLLFLFVVFVFLINVIYYIIYQNIEFLISTLHYIFILIGVYVFSYSIREKNFLESTYKIMKVNILVQLVIYLLNIGKYYGNTRYMGTFNDPNQFAFFIFLSIVYIYIIGNILTKNNNNLLYYLIVIYLIFESASAGMFMAIVIFYTFLLIVNFRESIYKLNKMLPKVIIIFMILTLTYVIFTYMDINILKIVISESVEINVFNRIEEKILRFTEKTNGPDFYQERGYDKIFYYPKYLLFGSGQGKYDRFENTYHMDEIHTTIPSIMFCYGIIPLIVLIKWIYLNLKRIPFNILVVFIAIFIESFTLQNQRQLLLWVLFILVNQYKNRMVGVK